MKNDSQSKVRPALEAQFLEDRYLVNRQGKSERLEVFEVVWITKGTGRFMLDLENHLITDNILYCIYPGQLYHFTPDPGVQGYRISFSDEFLSASGGHTSLPFALGYQSMGARVQVMRVNREIQTEIEEIVRTMIWECGNNFQFKSEILKGLLKIFIAMFSRRFDVDNRAGVLNNETQLFQRFMTLLDANFVVKKSVSEYASELAVSTNYLSETVSKVSGATAIHHIHQRIILEAKRLTMSSEATMKEISFQLGFLDSAHFSKFFKKNAGVNFSEFKSQLMGLKPVRNLENR